ncbi:hypothetical protein ACFQ07_08285, partial [Actinomadura adrarensis]
PAAKPSARARTTGAEASRGSFTVAPFGVGELRRPAPGAVAQIKTDHHPPGQGTAGTAAHPVGLEALLLGMIVSGAIDIQENPCRAPNP